MTYSKHVLDFIHFLILFIYVMGMKLNYTKSCDIVNPGVGVFIVPLIGTNNHMNQYHHTHLE